MMMMEKKLCADNEQPKHKVADKITVDILLSKCLVLFNAVQNYSRYPTIQVKDIA